MKLRCENKTFRSKSNTETFLILASAVKKLKSYSSEDAESVVGLVQIFVVNKVDEEFGIALGMTAIPMKHRNGTAHITNLSAHVGLVDLQLANWIFIVERLLSRLGISSVHTAIQHATLRQIVKIGPLPLHDIWMVKLRRMSLG